MAGAAPDVAGGGGEPATGPPLTGGAALSRSSRGVAAGRPAIEALRALEPLALSDGGSSSAAPTVALRGQMAAATAPKGAPATGLDHSIGPLPGVE